MKKFFKTLFVLIVAATLASARMAAAGDSMTLNMSSWLPPQHPIMTKGVGPWAEQIKQVTEGRVKVRILKKTVGSPANQYDVITKGMADIAYSNQSYTPDRFHLHTFAELPGMDPSAEASGVALWRTMGRFYPDPQEYKKIKVLSFFNGGPPDLYYSDKFNVTGMVGNDGIKIRCGAHTLVRVVEAMGMTAVQATIAKTMEMISNGVVDGTMNDPAAIAALGFDRYLKRRLQYPGGFGGYAFWMGINKDTWSKISEKDQKAIMAISGEIFARKFGKIWDAATRQGVISTEKNGVKTTIMEGKFKEDFDKIAAMWVQEYIDGVASSGADGHEVLKYYQEQLKEPMSE